MNLRTRAALLGGTPLVAMAGIAAILSAQNESSDARSTLAAGVITGSVMGASVIYEIDAWSLRRQSAVHFAAMVASVLPALYLSGWFPTRTPGDIAAIGGYFLVVGLIFWSVAYLAFGLVIPRIKDHPRAGS